MEKELQEKISRLQSIEQNVQQYVMQRQQFAMQQAELDSALRELENSEDSYKIIGNIMVKMPKDELKKDLGHKKEMIELRIKTVEKQENQLKEKVESLKSEVMGELKSQGK